VRATRAAEKRARRVGGTGGLGVRGRRKTYCARPRQERDAPVFLRHHRVEGNTPAHTTASEGHEDTDDYTLRFASQFLPSSAGPRIAEMKPAGCAAAFTALGGGPGAHRTPSPGQGGPVGLFTMAFADAYLDATPFHTTWKDPEGGGQGDRAPAGGLEWDTCITGGRPVLVKVSPCTTTLGIELCAHQHRRPGHVSPLWKDTASYARGGGVTARPAGADPQVAGCPAPAPSG